VSRVEDFPHKTGCCCLQTGRLAVCQEGGPAKMEPCIFCEAGKEIERLEAALRDIRDSTYRSALLLRSMADRALTGGGK
jgi:hypothetical protein